MPQASIGWQRTSMHVLPITHSTYAREVTHGRKTDFSGTAGKEPLFEGLTDRRALQVWAPQVRELTCILGTNAGERREVKKKSRPGKNADGWPSGQLSEETTVWIFGAKGRARSLAFPRCCEGIRLFRGTVYEIGFTAQLRLNEWLEPLGRLGTRGVRRRRVRFGSTHVVFRDWSRKKAKVETGEEIGFRRCRRIFGDTAERFC